YKGDSTWINLIAITAIKGSDGVAGREVEFQTTAEYVQWRYTGDTAWTKLIDLSLLKGTDGVPATISISDDGYWVINGEKTAYKVVSDIVEPLLCIVCFDLAAGEMPDGFNPVIEVVKGESITLPLPTKQGYLFVGWYTGDTVNDGQFLNFHTITKDITLYAHWKLDYQILQDYFNLFISDNYTVNTVSHYSYNYEDGYAEKELYQNYKRLLLDNKVLINLVTEEKDTFSVYIINQYDIMLYSSLQDRYWYSLFADDERICFNVNPGNFYYGDIIMAGYVLSYFTDITMFDKREGVNIYDYLPAADLIIEIFDLPFIGSNDGDSENSESDPYKLNAEIYLNLDLLTLTLEANQVLPGDRKITLFFEITLSEVGTTQFEIPIDEVKDFAYYQLDDWILNFDAECMVTDSYDEFMTIIDTARTDVNNAVDFDVIVALMVSTYEQIVDLYLIYDDLKSEKRNTKSEMQYILIDLIQTADDACIEEMQDLFDSYCNDIDLVETIDEIYPLYYQFIDDIDKVYVSDNVKYQLYESKNIAINELMFLFFDYREVLKNQENLELLYYLIKYYIDFIDKALTIDDVNNYFNAAIEIIEGLSLVDDGAALNEYKSSYKKHFEEYFSEKYHCCDTTCLEIYLQLLYFMDEIENASDFMTLYKALKIGKATIDESFINVIKNELLSYLAEMYEYYFSIVNDEDQNEVTDIYQDFLNIIDTTDDWDTLTEELENRIFSEFNHLEINSLKQIKHNKSIDLTFLFEEKKQTATDDSIVVMTEIYNDACDDIEICEDTLTLNLIYDEAMKAIQVSYEYDIQKMDIQGIIDFYHMAIDTWYYEISNNINEDSYQKNFVERFFNDYHCAFKLINSEDEAKRLINECRLTLSDLRLSYDIADFEGFKDMLLDHCDDAYWYVKSYKDIVLADDFDDIYLFYRDLANDTANFTDFIYYFVEINFYLYRVLVNTLRISNLELLDETYVYYYQIIISDELDILETEYNRIRTMILTMYIEWRMYDAFDEFISFLAELEVSPLNEAIVNAKHVFKDELDELKLTATAESIIVLDNLYNNYLSQFDDCETPDAVDILMAEVFTQMHAAYIMDYNKYELNYWTDQYLGLITIYYDFICDNVNGKDLYDISAKSAFAKTALKNAVSIDDAEQTYNDWVLNVPNSTFNYNQYTINNLRNILICYLNSLYFNYPGYDSEFTALYQLHKSYIEAADSVRDIYNKFQIGYFAMSEDINDALCVLTMQDITDLYEDNLGTISEDELAEFNNYYQSIIQTCNDNHYSGIIYYLYVNFYDFCQQYI
ncbi:MAG: InlB B-repeat-containing protein, partial [Bacilli bacterium]|nr:InlB B-repeat-containing protein [Bacilli bacterium]